MTATNEYSAFIYDKRPVALPCRDGCFEANPYRKLSELQSLKFVCYDVDAPEIRKIPPSCLGTILAKNKEAAVALLKSCVTHYKPTSCENCNRFNDNATRNPEIPTIERLAEIGQSEIIKTISKEDRSKLNYPNILRSMVKAAAGGHVETMKVFKGWDVFFSYNMSLARAAENGHLEAMNKLREWGAVDYELAFASAAGGGHVEAMNVLGGWGASNYDTALICAAEGGHVEAMNLLKTWGASSSYNKALARAAAGGQLEAMKVLRTWGATDYRAAFYDAAASGCTSALKLLNEWYTSTHDYDTALAISAINGREDAIKFLVQLGASDYDRALVHAAAACRIKALKLIIELKNQKEMNRRDT